MTIKDIVMNGGGLLLVLATLVQISPLKLDPWTWLARWIGRAINGEVLDRLEKLEKRLGALEDMDEQRDVVNSRIRILRFGDECQEDRWHSKEHWDQTMRDITKYEHYCKAHPDFENDITVETAKYLKGLYHEMLRGRKFSAQNQKESEDETV